MRTLTEFNRGRVGLMGVVVTLLVTGVGQTFMSVPMLFACLLYTSPSPRDGLLSRMPSSA